jgi:hypothetical protein
MTGRMDVADDLVVLLRLQYGRISEVRNANDVLFRAKNFTKLRMETGKSVTLPFRLNDFS